MVRVKNGLTKHARHQKFIKQAKWFRLGRGKLYKQVREALVKQWQNAYIGRKLKKRDFRRLWIERLSAALRQRGEKYSSFIDKMTQKDVLLNRKVLSNIAIAFPEVFDKIVKVVQK